MPEHDIIHLPFGRLATVERPHTARGKAERVAVLDVLPLRVARVSEDEAPVALASLGPDLADAETWRAHGGRLYRPLWASERGLGCTPEAAAKEMRHRAEWEAEDKSGYWVHHRGEQVFDNGPLRKAAVAGRGLREEGGHPVRRTLDDGRDAQAVAVADAASNLLLVDGRLHHAAPVPGWRICDVLVNVTDRTTQLDNPALRVSTTIWRPHHRPRERNEVTMPNVRPWLVFGPDRGNEADAVAQALVAALGRTSHPETRPELRPRMRGEAYAVRDRAAYLSASPPTGPEAWVARVGGAFLAAAAGTLGRMPTEAVGTYLAARRAVDDVAGAGGHEAAFEAVRAVADLVKAHAGYDGRTIPEAALLGAHILPLRYDLFERHRIPEAPVAAEIDMPALAALARP